MDAPNLNIYINYFTHSNILVPKIKFPFKFQDSQIYVDVRPDHSELNNLPEVVERRKLSELARELDVVKGDIMLLYTEYTAKAGQDLKGFLKNVSTYAEDAILGVQEKPDTIDVSMLQ